MTHHILLAERYILAREIHRKGGFIEDLANAFDQYEVQYEVITDYQNEVLIGAAALSLTWNEQVNKKQFKERLADAVTAVNIDRDRLTAVDGRLPSEKLEDNLPRSGDVRAQKQWMLWQRIKYVWLGNYVERPKYVGLKFDGELLEIDRSRFHPRDSFAPRYQICKYFHSGSPWQALSHDWAHFWEDLNKDGGKTCAYSHFVTHRSTDRNSLKDLPFDVLCRPIAQRLIPALAELSISQEFFLTGEASTKPDWKGSDARKSWVRNQMVFTPDLAGQTDHQGVSQERHEYLFNKGYDFWPPVPAVLLRDFVKPENRSLLDVNILLLGRGNAGKTSMIDNLLQTSDAAYQDYIDNSDVIRQWRKEHFGEGETQGSASSSRSGFPNARVSTQREFAMAFPHAKIGRDVIMLRCVDLRGLHIEEDLKWTVKGGLANEGEGARNLLDGVNLADIIMYVIPSDATDRDLIEAAGLIKRLVSICGLRRDCLGQAPLICLVLNRLDLLANKIPVFVPDAETSKEVKSCFGSIWGPKKIMQWQQSLGLSFDDLGTSIWADTQNGLASDFWYEVTGEGFGRGMPDSLQRMLNGSLDTLLSGKPGKGGAGSILDSECSASLFLLTLGASGSFDPHRDRVKYENFDGLVSRLLGGSKLRELIKRRMKLQDAVWSVDYRWANSFRFGAGPGE